MIRFGLVILTLVLALGGGPKEIEAANVQHVILLHGWKSDASAWDKAKALYEAAGIQAHALDLPRDGTHTGDTLLNADYVEQYIAQNNLTNVQVDGHSLGGTLVYELIRVRLNPAIISAVTRDSSIHGDPDTGKLCLEGIGVPDQCDGPVRSAILAAPLAAVPVLNVSKSGAALADVDCNKTRKIAHIRFGVDKQTNEWAIQWAEAELC